MHPLSLLQSVARPHSVHDWKLHGLDWLIDVGVDVAVSFGSQSLVRDFVTGFFLQLEHQFALGDVIRIGGFEGTVENITLRLVYLRDATGALHIIPNGQITQVTNLTRAWGRVAVDVEVAWHDADRAEQAVMSAAEA